MLSKQEYRQYDAAGLAEAIRQKEISSSEARQCAQRAVKEADAKLNAVVCDIPNPAPSPTPSNTNRLLSGVPTALKDNVEYADLPCRVGSRATPASLCKAHGEFTQHFLSSGMQPIVKTTLPEFGFTATTEFTHQEPTRNPWNLDYSTGGSSGGSAALVAAGTLPIAHANDGGGSIRIPAACCGLVGLKPSRGRLKNEATAKHLPVNIVSEGVVTRSVRDTAAFYADMEAHRQNPSLPPIGHITQPGQKRLRIAMYTDFQGDGKSSAEVNAAVEAVASTCEALGHQVIPISTPVNPQMADDFLLYWATLASAMEHGGKLLMGSDFDPEQLEPLTINLSRHAKKNFWRIPGAIKRLKDYQHIYSGYFSNFDCLLTPTLATAPKKIGELALDLDFDTLQERLYGYTAFTPVQNVSGGPAISLPLAQSEAGLPIGIQFAAAFGQEQTLLEIALELEGAMPWGYQGIDLA